jgi:amidohydrolase
MDALPVTELADVSYKSKNEGVMHACGHDGHMSSLLGAALILNELKDQLSGEVKLMFQPAEELGAGARKMISEGVLENPKVDIAFGIHVSPVLPAGHIYTKVGGFFSAPNIFAIKIIGKGSHGALPHLGIDPINISSQFISCAQSLITRQMVATQPVVLSFCKIQGGNSYNVIPDYVDISGTLRTFSEENRKSMKNKVKLLLEGITSAYGATYELK